MKHTEIIKKLLLSLLLSLTIVSCGEKDCPINPLPPTPPAPPTVKAERTLFMYFPWSVNLLSAFQKNLEDMEQAISESGLGNSRVVVMLYTSGKEAEMFEYKTKTENGKRKVERKQIKKYQNHSQKTVDGIYEVIKRAMEYAPAHEYAMSIGCHGMAWVPSGILPRGNATRVGFFKKGVEWEDDYQGEYFYLPTRWYGGGKTGEYHAEVKDLAEALRRTGNKLKFLLFDDCYMVSAETSYELRDVTEHIIGSPCEIMEYGLPYHKIGKYLISGENYEAICKEFYDFYHKYPDGTGRYPYGTIAVIRTSEIEKLSELAREINAKGYAQTQSVQRLGGYTPVIFEDLGSYFKSICGNDANFLERLQIQMDKTVPYKTHTGAYYSSIAGRSFQIRDYSGMTVSDGTRHADVVEYKKKTPWYIYTHSR